MAWNGLPRNDETRFWSLTTPEPNTGCWLWLGTLNSRGYGVMRYEGKVRSAHRLAFRFSRGRASRQQVNHRCDQSACVNPAHLYEGDQLQNMRDRAVRGRCNAAHGETHHWAKLSADAVRAIRDSAESARVLAERFGVNRTTVTRIRRGDRWKGG